MSGKIDESLYSRQLYAIGHDAMEKMGKSNVLIVGVSGLGTEIAKNIILSGVQSVILHDTDPVTLNDLSTGYYFDKTSIGKNRAIIAGEKLKELNPYVKVAVDNNRITKETLKHCTVLVVTNRMLDSQLKYNKLARETNTCFIATSTMGLTGQLFCDFGDKFFVTDSDGEKAKTSLIANISIEEEAIVTTLDKEPHDLQNGDVVNFSDVGLNLKEEYKVKVIDRYNFKIGNTKGKGTFRSGGFFTQIKQPREFKFKPMHSAVSEPQFMYSDLAHFDRPSTLHVCYQVLSDFVSFTKRFPKNDKDYSTFLKMAKELDEKVDKNIIEKFVRTYNSRTMPVVSFIGGIAAQEALKACSQKFSPIFQWFYFDALDCLKTMTDNSSESRYKSQVRLFGNEFQDKLSKLNYFIVGSGAIGCELLKNFAMIGVGNITVTDMDTIEKSNLNRQFLFRSTDIGKPKSVAAAAAIGKMNNEIKVTAHLNRVGPESEDVYNSRFFSKLDGVANALDNVQARLYMDSQCVLHGKPLFESGTLGTKGNVQVVVPKLTESYGSSPDPPEKEVPICTLKNFPYLIEHTIQFARDNFAKWFEMVPKSVNEFMTNPKYLESLPHGEKISVAKDLRKTLNEMNAKTYDDCVKIGFNLFHEQYRDQILQLLHNFPRDSKTKTGLPFWTGSKKCPDAIIFNRKKDLHIEYVFTFAQLWSQVLHIKPKGKKYTHNLLKNFKPPEFSVKDVKIATTEEEAKEETSDESFEQVVSGIPKVTMKCFPLKFEKDDDTNYHIDFVTACSNLRATNYKITTADKYKTKGIAGKIIPALATTTAVVAGLVTLELLRLVQGEDDVEKYRNAFINLALPMCTFSEPLPPKVEKFKGKKYTMWDYIELRPKTDMTLKELIDTMEREYGEVSMVNYGSCLLYAFFNQDNEKLEMKIRELLESMIKKKINSDFVRLDVSIDCDEDLEEGQEEEDIPPIKYYF